MKKALVYDPYLDTMGGGERYALTVASALKAAGYLVTFAWPDRRTLRGAVDRFNLESDFDCDAIAHDVFVQGSLFSKWKLTKEYNLVFFVSDGSLPFLFGRKNLVHFQVPFTRIGGNSLINLGKIARIDKFIYNSQFTKNIVEKQLPTSRGQVIYPPIDIESFVPGKKENLILSVARFDSPSHAKRQDVLIDAFKALHQENKTFKLILTGGLLAGEEYLDSLKAKAGKLPIEFIPNPDFGQLKKLYAKAKIFWHATGYGIDEVGQPEKVEHFGITTVEAMAAGAVPVVINKGGQREIVTGETGYLCDSIEEIVRSTLSLINSPEKLKLMSQKATEAAKEFSSERFIRRVSELVGND
ncbi:hypothetical protein A3A84_03565 [Candidatus Collierbacteria bacterium RIFCSPLOWO2_01_FULL_50_23]|uniref:Glycosyl transferase family 1 domain-containing protein n=2 Tax=Candidatus Collieribacteriota TaxID=1752725 RepID=A0A1F5EU82_9BACT|nr:MAG: hypothetical protein A3D09_02945 [Candidatus Collierbacteria bacterium RIFCSPHIGHO2_02_FULL_49_10]OGD71558.1 MAG: hypothetical protein A2703_02125 [Candidatus Collierbacteria bacterium RIFCSPHIGHO2_01_FULL_50_25]OGD74361.1 MAG: hypothetical protein A3A84_03565 [Candidatus Collierbacteria bacterium RIFCSPLOWO2_01_FULL_50_23]